MLSLTEIKEELDLLMLTKPEELNLLMLTKPDQHTDSELNKIKKRIQFLKTCANYLESNPSEEFIQSEHKRLTNLIKSVVESFPMWRRFNPQLCIGKNNNECKSFYERENNLPHLKMQLKTLTFIKQSNHVSSEV